MKKSLMAVVLTGLMAAAAQAQVTLEYTRNTRRSSLTVTYTSGYGYGFGGGVNYGYGLGTTSGASMGGFSGLPYGYAGSPYGGGYYPGGGYGGWHRYGGWGTPVASAGVAGPPSGGFVPDRLSEYAVARGIEEGRRRLKSGDYKGAVDEFRAAVTSRTDDAGAQAWFAVALLLAGDGRNADKALRAAAAGGLTPDQPGLADAFRDAKEFARVVSTLGKWSGDGAFAAAYVLARVGDPAKLKALAEKDPAGRLLLPKP